MRKLILTIFSIIILCSLVAGYVVYANVDIESPGVMRDLGKDISQSAKANEVIIEVGDIKITDKELEELKIKYDYFQQDSSDENYRKVINSLIRQKFLLNEAEKYGVLYSFEEAQKKALEEISMISSDVKNSDAVLAYIESLGLTKEEYAKTIHAKEIQIIASLSLLQEYLTQEAIKNGQLNIPEDKTPIEVRDIKRAYFDEWYNNAYSKMSINVKDARLSEFIK